MTETETIVLELQDQISGPAADARAALGGLEAEITKGGSALRDLEEQMRVMQGASVVDVSSYRALNDAIVMQKGAVGDLQSKYIALGGSASDALKLAKGPIEDVGEAAEGAKIPLGAMAKASKMLGGEVGGSASKVLRLTKAILTMGGPIALVVVAFAIVAGAIAGFVGIIAKGIESAGAMRDELLKLEGASKGSVKAGQELQSAISSVSSSSALARDKITEYALQLNKAKVTGKDLKTSLEAMAIAGSAGGDEMAQAFLKSVEAARASGGSVDALAKKVRTQLGGVAREQALSLGVQMSKLKENITTIFSGADIEPFLLGLHSVLGLLDANSEAGKSLKESIATMVNASIGYMLRLAIFLVKTYTAIKSNAVAWELVKDSAIVVVGIIGAVIVALGGALVAVLSFGALVLGPLVAVVAAVSAVYSSFGNLWAWFTSHSWAEIGTAIITGLVDGIRSAGGAVLDALTGVVQGAISGVKGLLGIHSPSLVFAQLGQHTAGGMAQGIDRGAGAVADAAGGLATGAAGAVAAPAPSMVAAGGPSGEPSSPKASASGGQFTFTNCVFGGDLTKEKLEEWMTEILEGRARETGAPA